MIIHFERSGGFTAIKVSSTLDTSKLPPEEARKLQEEVENSGFFQLPAKLSAPSGGADRFQYRLTIEQGGKKHTVEAGEAAVPDGLWPLLRHLTVLARSS